MKPLFDLHSSPHFALLTFCILHSAFCNAQTVPLRWAAELGDARPARFTLVRGDTVELAADLFAEGRPYLPATADAALLWQTNGMGALWWEVPASVASNRVTATWTPAMDCGSSSYLAHFRVGSSTGSVFRAYARLAVQHGPGDPVNALPLPVQILDFAKITVTNEPWSTVSGLSTNDVQAIVAAATADAVRTNELGSATISGDLTAENLEATDNLDVGGNVYLSGGSLYSMRGRFFYNPTGDASSGHELAVKGDIPDLNNYTGNITTGGSIDAGSIAVQGVSLGTAAFRNANEFATAADEQLVYQLLMGSNVVAEVTNYNSRVHAPQLRLLQLDPDTHEYYTVWAETNGLTRTLNEGKAYTDAVSNALDMAKADRAWSKHTSGLGADAPEGVTWISTPETVISGGYEYERHITTHGEVWVLTSNGMGFGGDSNSYFRVSTPDGETLFSIEKTDEQIIGIQTDGISVSGGTVTLNVGVVTYNGQAPICMAAQSVTGPWADLSEGRPAWISSVATNGVNGAWSFELESTSSAAFFFFRVRQPGATVIKNSAQTDFSGGILVEGTRFYPHKSGTTLTWTTTP